MTTSSIIKFPKEGVKEAVYYFNRDINIVATIFGSDVNIEIMKCVEGHREAAIWQLDMEKSEFLTFFERIQNLIKSHDEKDSK